jgi:peroxiredoxin
MSMATTPSTMTELGRNAPQFALPNVLTGKTVTLGDFEGRTAMLVMFICKHCPYVRHVKPALIQLAVDYADQPLGIVSICSNDAERYPDDAPERIAEMARELPFPLLYDETQEVAGLPSGMHSRLLSVRFTAPHGVPRSIGRQPSRQRSAADGSRSASGDRRCSCGQAG